MKIMVIKNYKVKTSLTTSNPPTGVDTLILTGAENSTVVKSLEILIGNENAIVNIFRKDANDSPYGNIKVDMNAYDYIMLWEGFIAIPSGHTLWINASSNQVEAVANVVEL